MALTQKVHFDGTETASHQPYLEQAETIEGPTMLLTDAENLCAFARFCDPKGRIWNLVEQTDNPEAQRLVKHEAGTLSRRTTRGVGSEDGQTHRAEVRTVARTNRRHGQAGQRPDLGARRHSGDFRGRENLRDPESDDPVPCGRSANKPFCDGSHAA